MRRLRHLAVMAAFSAAISFSVAGLVPASARADGSGMDGMKMPMDKGSKPAKGKLVGNKICPVSGDKIDPNGPRYTYKYKGKTYNFCSPDCVDDFKKDPGKYIKKMKQTKTGTGEVKQH